LLRNHSAQREGKRRSEGRWRKKRPLTKGLGKNYTSYSRVGLAREARVWFWAKPPVSDNTAEKIATRPCIAPNRGPGIWRKQTGGKSRAFGCSCWHGGARLAGWQLSARKQKIRRLKLVCGGFPYYWPQRMWVVGFFTNCPSGKNTKMAIIAEKMEIGQGAVVFSQKNLRGINVDCGLIAYRHSGSDWGPNDCLPIFMRKLVSKEACSSVLECAHQTRCAGGRASRPKEFGDRVSKRS